MHIKLCSLLVASRIVFFASLTLDTHLMFALLSAYVPNWHFDLDF